MPDSSNQYGSFVPTTFLLEAAQLQQVDVTSQEFKQLMVKLYQSLNTMALVINTKTTGFFLPSESNTGNIFFANPLGNYDVLALRNSFSVAFDYGPLPNAGASARPHGIVDIDNLFTMVKIQAVATNPTTQEFLVLPYVSIAGDEIQLDVDATNVTITTVSDRTAFTRTMIALEYLRN